MPANVEPKLLKQCCLKRIALSFESYWMRSFNEELKDVPRLMYVIGPFDDLTNRTIQDIIDSLAKEECLKRSHLTVLLQESVVNLDLSNGYHSMNHDSVLQTIHWRCPRLVSLNLSRLRNLTPRGMSDLFWQVAGLRSLDLSLTNCTDQVLSVLGNNCFNLVKLVANNTGIGNSGIFSLCQACHSDRGCKKLVTLNISDTLVNTVGALHCVQNLPLLQFLYFNNICQIVEKDIENREKDGKELHQYKLRRLFTDSLHSSSAHSIEIACRWCPNVTEAHFYTGLNGENIHVLKTLTNLKELSIGNDGSEFLNFQTHVLPVLEVIGQNLHKLGIYDVSGVNILSIGVHCRNLQFLFIVLNDDASLNVNDGPLLLTTKQKWLLFAYLIDFGIVYPYEETSYQVDAVVCLLKSAKMLKSLVCRYMKCLTSDHLLDIFTENPFTDIEKIHLEHCNNVGPECIWPLLQGKNNLTSLELYDCWLVSRNDFEEFQKYARKNNFSLQVKWK